MDLHESLDDLMVKAGNCVDKTALRVLNEQVFAIRVGQMAATNTDVMKSINDLITIVDKILICTRTT